MTARSTPVLVAGSVLLAAAGIGFWLSGAGSGDGPAGAASTSGRMPTGAPSGVAGRAAGASTGPATEGGRVPGSVRPQGGGPVRDGDLEFTVSGVQLGVGALGTVIVRKPVGQFVLVTVSVRNRGSRAVRFDGGGQFVYDGQGRQFDADDEAGLYLDRSRPFLDPVLPGNSVSGVLVFDLPRGAAVASVELHAAAGGEGVTVRLR